MNESQTITTTPEAILKATEVKSEEKTVQVVEEIKAAMNELVKSIQSQPKTIIPEIPEVYKQNSQTIQVKDVKHKLGFTSLAIARAHFNRELGKINDEPFTKEIKEMGIDPVSFLPEHAVKNLNASVFTDGGVLVPEVWEAEIIPLLSAGSVVRKAGARIVDMPYGNTNFTKALTNASFYWVSEVGVVTKSAATFGSITLTQHLGGVKVPISDMLLKTGRLNTAQLIEDMILKAMEEGEDQGFLLGSGSAAQPNGIANQISASNVVSMTGGGSPTAATRKTDLLNAETKLINSNVKMENVVWFMNPKVKQNLKVQVDSNSNPMDYAREIMNSNTLFGYPIFTTTQIPFSGTCNVYLIDMQYVIIGQGEAPTLEFFKNGSYWDGTKTVSGQDTRESVFSAIEGVDIVLTEPLAGAKITGVTWGA